MTLAIGVLGAAIILTFFILEQAKKINNDSVLYDAGNFIGSSLLVVYAHLLSSIPFLILNLIWAGYSLRDLFKDLNKK